MATTFDDLVNEVRGVLRGYNLVREQITFLGAAITSTALTATVADGTLVQPGVVEIGSESLYVQSITGATLTISPDGRGWDRTTAASHLIDARVTVSPPYPTWRIARAINDAIIGTWPTLYAVSNTSFVYNPSVTTYSLPADCDNVLAVTATTWGPSRDQVEIHAYKFNSNAPTAEFATGNCITLLNTPDPGRTVTVIYQKAPSEIVTGNNFTVSGLAETARACIIYGAVGRLLSFVDATRTLVASAVSSEYADAQRIGTATQLAGQLSARYQMELDMEQRRLTKANPVKVRWVGR